MGYLLTLCTKTYQNPPNMLTDANQVTTELPKHTRITAHCPKSLYWKNGMSMYIYQALVRQTRITSGI